MAEPTPWYRRWLRPRTWLPTLGILIIGGASIAWYNQSPALNSNVARIHAVQANGKPLPNFELIDFQGNRFHLNDLKGKPVLLDFWASWCPPCRLSMPELERMTEQYQGRVEILAINIMEPVMDGVRFSQEAGYQLNYTRSDKLADYLGIRVLPSKVLLDAKGNILWAGVGHIPIATHQLLERHI